MEEPGQLKTAFINATAGSLLGAISWTVTSPLDVIKIRFQVIAGGLVGIMTSTIIFLITHCGNKA